MWLDSLSSCVSLDSLASPMLVLQPCCRHALHAVRTGKVVCAGCSGVRAGRQGAPSAGVLASWGSGAGVLASWGSGAGVLASCVCAGGGDY